MKFLQALRNVSGKLTAEFEDSKLFEHSGEIGEIREQLISQLLRPFLPECYGLGTGQIFSLDGETSKQIDIVIYDSIYSNVLFKNKTSNLFPCESVYGEIEIKSNLSTDELIASLDNIESVKKLSRENSTMLDITPISHLTVGNGLSASTNKLNPYLGIVFGFDGLTSDTLLKTLNEEMTKRNKANMPDFIFCHKRQYMVLKVNGTTVAPLGGDFEKYVVIPSGTDTIPMMFVTLNTCLNGIRLKAPNFNQYWVQLFGEITKTK
jgi:hypothetical protein